MQEDIQDQVLCSEFWSIVEDYDRQSSKASCSKLTPILITLFRALELDWTLWKTILEASLQADSIFYN